jgi:hypothetical protein
MRVREFEAARERRADLLREVERERIARRLRAGVHRSEARGFWDRLRSRVGLAPPRSGNGMASVRVRWGLPEDEGKISDLLQMNGASSRLAKEGFIVAERGGAVLAAVRYRTEAKRLLLGLLVSDPWLEERPLAEALYAGARELAREMGVTKIRREPAG